VSLPWKVPINSADWLVRLAGQSGIVALMLNRRGRLELHLHDGGICEAAVDAHTVVTVPLIVVRYRIDGSVRSLPLTVSATGAEGHRRLRVWLRCLARADPRQTTVFLDS
jgi:hypothetical protein